MVYQVKEISLDNGLFATMQSNGTLVIHNVPSNASDQELEQLEPLEIHITAEQLQALDAFTQTAVIPVTSIGVQTAQEPKITLSEDERGNVTITGLPIAAELQEQLCEALALWKYGVVESVS